MSPYCTKHNGEAITSRTNLSLFLTSRHPRQELGLLVWSHSQEVYDPLLQGPPHQVLVRMMIVVVVMVVVVRVAVVLPPAAATSTAYCTSRWMWPVLLLVFSGDDVGHSAAGATGRGQDEPPRGHPGGGFALQQLGRALLLLLVDLKHLLLEPGRTSGERRQERGESELVSCALFVTLLSSPLTRLNDGCAHSRESLTDEIIFKGISHLKN